MVNKPRYIHIIAMLPIFILDSDEAMMSLIYNSTNRNVVPEHHWLDFMYSRTRSFKFWEFMPDIFKFLQLEGFHVQQNEILQVLGIYA